MADTYLHTVKGEVQVRVGNLQQQKATVILAPDAGKVFVQELHDYRFQERMHFLKANQENDVAPRLIHHRPAKRILEMEYLKDYANLATLATAKMDNQHKEAFAKGLFETLKKLQGGAYSDLQTLANYGVKFDHDSEGALKADVKIIEGGVSSNRGVSAVDYALVVVTTMMGNNPKLRPPAWNKFIARLYK